MRREVEATITAGVCGFTTRVAALSEDGQQVTLEITSDCATVRSLADAMPPLDAYTEIGAGHSGNLMSVVRNHMQGCCSGCVVPAGLFKAMQVSAGLALPRPASIEFRKIST